MGKQECSDTRYMFDESLVNGDLGREKIRVCSL